ncbi:MAG: thioredoxin family protein [Celeribacter sp.]|jgi:thioredoxin-related protein
MTITRRRILSALAAMILALPVGGAWAKVGDDGLHDAAWIHETFKDLREDLQEAQANDQRLVLIFEQRGCIYCNQMHEEVFPVPEITQRLTEDYFVVQLNLHGATEVTDFDGEVLTEKQIARKWGILFTPTMMFLPEDVPDDMSAAEAAVTQMPGAFGKWTTLNMLDWVLNHGYEGEEGFQAYHARMLREQAPGGE